MLAAIAPHGHLAIAEACTDEERALAAATRAGLEDLGRRADAIGVEAIVVLTPHGIHLERAMAVVVASRMAGELDGAPRRVALDVPVDRDLALSIAAAMRDGGVPTVGTSFGGNDPAEAVMPMDWGVLVPLWFLGGRSEPPRPVVVVSPARDLPPDLHVAAGRAVADAIAADPRPIALVASADQSHVHRADGPYGYHAAAVAHDRHVAQLVASDRLGELLEMEPAMIEDAKPDAWWQMLMLHGALGDAWHAEVLAAEAPTYYGMLTATYAPRGSTSAPGR